MGHQILNKDKMKSFSFWSELYKKDPDEFRRQEKEEIEKVILSAPEGRQHKLRQLQWKLDAIKKTHSNMAATIKISQLMWESFEELKIKLNALESLERRKK